METEKLREKIKYDIETERGAQVLVYGGQHDLKLSVYMSLLFKILGEAAKEVVTEEWPETYTEGEKLLALKTIEKKMIQAGALCMGIVETTVKQREEREKRAIEKGKNPKGRTETYGQEGPR